MVNRAIATQEVIEELIKLAKQLSAADKRGEDLGLSNEEIAFYDALSTNESAMQAMGDAKLRVIATELVTQIRKSVTIDWTLGANDDEWISAVASYVRVAFGNRSSLVSPEDVARVRAAHAGRTKPWTLAELSPQLPRPLTNRAAWKMKSNEPPTGSVDGAVSLPYRVESPHTPGAWLQVELPAAVEITDVRLVCSRWPRNYPRGYKLELSTDGVTWSEPAAAGKNAAAVLEISFQPTKARWIRFTQTEPPTGRPWILDDLIIFERSPPAPAAGAVL